MAGFYYYTRVKQTRNRTNFAYAFVLAPPKNVSLDVEVHLATLANLKLNSQGGTTSYVCHTTRTWATSGIKFIVGCDVTVSSSCACFLDYAVQLRHS